MLRALALTAALLPAPAPEASPQTFVVQARTALDRAAVAGTGAAIITRDHGTVTVTASSADVQRLRDRGFEPERTRGRPAAEVVGGFVAEDGAYHDYAELEQHVRSVAQGNPALVGMFTLGTSHEGRQLWAAKISDNVGTDEPEPEALFTAGVHAREHLGVEMGVYLLDELTSRYAADPRVKQLVDEREIWIVFDVNPDGSEHDITEYRPELGWYLNWRRNRQPNAGWDATPEAVGTDLNRNFGFKWGCCNGSSTDVVSDTYRGPAPFSAPESQRVRDFVNSRVVDGVQQIKVAIDFHAFSELVMWPYGYTAADTEIGMTDEQQRAFRTLGEAMAATNGYTPEQASDLYVADGTIMDWLWGEHKILAYTFEMYPRTQGGEDFYPDDAQIPQQTARNREAVLMLLEHAGAR